MPSQKRESQWNVLRRCLVLIRQVQREAMDWHKLVKAVEHELMGQEPYGNASEEQIYKIFKKDLERIRSALQINIYHSSDHKGYILRPGSAPWLDLPDGDLATLAWLEHTFDEDSPKHHEVNGLLQRVRLLLGEQREADMNRQIIDLAVNLARRDNNHVAVEAKLNLTKAILEKRRVELKYLALDRQREQPLRHVVDPYELFFEHGHYYLKGWTHYTVSAEFAQVSQQTYFFYRLDAILQVTLLTSHIPPPPPAHQEAVIYQLSRKLARRPSRQRWIEIEDIQTQPDGTAIVYGKTDAPFYAIQAIIRYREECKVLGGPIFLERMRETVRKMAENYGFI